MLRRLILLLSICYGIASPASAANSDYEHYSEQKALRLGAVHLDRSQVGTYQRLTLDIDLDATYDNAFDARQISVDVMVTAPDGTHWTAPGFFYVPYQRDEAATDSRLTVPAGQPGWQARLSFAGPGRYELVVIARDRTGTVRSEPAAVEVVKTNNPGMIRRHKSNPHYFVTDRGETWFAVGANVCWGETRGAHGRHVFAYDEWFPKYAEAGCNYARIWLSLEWNDLASITRRSGYDRIDLQRAWHLDHVLDLAERRGLYLMLCFDAHGMLRSNKTLHGFWEMSPLHPDHGAPMARPMEFFTHAKMRDAYRNRLRYLVARYGYSTNVFAWEFFNEVDLIDDYDSKVVTDWHREMATHLRQIDPWKHLITTSFARPQGGPAVDGLAELDFVQTHHYQAKDIAAAFAVDVRDKTAARNRPHFHGEFGINHSGQETGRLDPNGIHLHNGLYSSLGLGAAGTPMTWWWDSYVHPRDLYPIWSRFTRWLDGFDFIAQEARPIEAELQWIDPQAGRPARDFLLTVSDQSWKPAPFNKPTEVRIDAKGKAAYAVKPAGILHGLRNHRDLHNPVTFHLETSRPTRFIVDVGEVSAHGGAALQILLDGREAFRADFVDEDDPEKGGKLPQFAGSYGVDVPAGRHTVVAKGVGNDWLFINAYRIPGIVHPETPPLRALGVVGRTKGLVWIQNLDFTWSQARRSDFNPYVVTESRLVLRDLEPGRWTIEHWNPQTGTISDSLVALVSNTGRLEVNLPTITWDHALRLRRD